MLLLDLSQFCRKLDITFSTDLSLVKYCTITLQYKMSPFMYINIYISECYIPPVENKNENMEMSSQ